MKKIIILFLMFVSSIGFAQSFSLKINNISGSSPLNCTYEIKVVITAHKAGHFDESYNSTTYTSIAPSANQTFSHTFSAGYTVDYSTLHVYVEADLTGGGICTVPSFFNASAATHQGNNISCIDSNDVTVWSVVTTNSEYNIKADVIVK